MLNNIKITEIDLDFVKNYLKIDYEDDDILLFTMLSASKSYIQSYLNRKFDDFDEIPDEFSIACLALVAHWYDKREIQSEKASKDELKYVFSGLLDIHRNWNATQIDEIKQIEPIEEVPVVEPDETIEIPPIEDIETTDESTNSDEEPIINEVKSP